MGNIMRVWPRTLAPVWVGLSVWLSGAPALAGAAERSISYNREIRPILSDNCFACHGFDEKARKGKLRLDVRENAVAREAIKPGAAAESELIKRIFTTDADELMPPAESHKVLSAAQKDLLRDWINQGAKYEGHWAYVPPVKAEIPAGEHPIDYLVQQRLKDVGLQPSPAADRRTLARRLAFDLTGLPPTPDEVREFEADSSASATKRFVEKLMASPEYGERMAIPWLDAVRFADTIGYHSDNPRNIWPYRDYVIRAFNENLPFDQFTREQLAGDLLPGSTLRQKVGSAFNRLLLTTEEGGAQPKDYEARMLTDRVRAVGTVWLGQTIGCAQCHDHKFDPITSRDFYAMGAFFADIKEPIIGKREDGITVPNEEQAAELARREAALKKAQEEFDAPRPELDGRFAEWREEQLQRLLAERSWMPVAVSEMRSTGNATLEAQPGGSILVKGEKPEQDTYRLRLANVASGTRALRLEALTHDSLPAKGPGRSGNGNFVLTEVVAKVVEEGREPKRLAFARASATFEQTSGAEKHPDKRWSAASVIDRDERGANWGWAILPEAGQKQNLVLEFGAPVELSAGQSLELEIQHQYGSSHSLGHFRVTATAESTVASAPAQKPVSGELAEALSAPASNRTEAQRAALLKRFKNGAEAFALLRERLETARRAKTEYEASLPRCIVSVSAEEPRTVRILPRGNFLIETGEAVGPAFPAYLAPAPAEGKKPNRLDLANWLVDRQNPLTARVVINRIWKQFFGMGLTKVADDLGAQGEPPSNQALLDWLACEFIDSGWDVKHMVRLMVTSAAYQRSSVVSPELRARDPQNRELAAQNRWRLEAELVRDNALAISGLLVRKVGGPSVKPYQPDGYWENLNFPPRNYDASADEGQYRRGLYTWWQRSFVHPSMLAFDAPTREECAADRGRSNIPQQALVLLNDPSYVEASRAFATRILTEQAGSLEERIRFAWLMALARPPRAEETAAIQALVEKQLAEYRADPEAAKKLLQVGFKPAPSGLDPAELAAWTNAARVILNLHETVTRS